MTRFVGLVIRGAMLACLAASGAPAQAVPRSAAAVRDSVLDAQTAALSTQLRCPVCQGLSIQDSPSELSQQMKALVRDQLAAGKTPDEVKAYFVSKYGEWILLAPKASGFNLIAYGLPVLVVLGGGVLIAIAVRRWTAPPPIPPTPSAPPVAQGDVRSE